MPIPKYVVLERICASYGFTRKEMGEFLDQMNVQDAVDMCAKMQDVYGKEIQMKHALYITRECEYLG